MRNILEYPITPDEVVTSLQLACEDIANQQRVGDIQFLCLFILLKHLQSNPQIIQDAIRRDEKEQMSVA